jgi:hypothetical protein
MSVTTKERRHTTADVVAAVASGKKQAEVARMFGISHQAVSIALIRSGRTPRRKGPNTCNVIWTDDLMAALRDLWDQGIPTAEIGRRIGASNNAVIGKAHRLDLPARPSPIKRRPA